MKFIQDHRALGSVKEFIKITVNRIDLHHLEGLACIVHHGGRMSHSRTAAEAGTISMTMSKGKKGGDAAADLDAARTRITGKVPGKMVI